jgi:hypothetical protein
MALDGTWDVTLQTPMGAQQGTLQLSTEGDTLNGSFTSARGTQQFTGTANGDEFSWKSTVQGPMGQLELTWNGKLAGEEINGKVQFGSFGGGDFKGVRAAVTS